MFAGATDAGAHVYDVARNRFRTVKLPGHPAGHNIGLMYDPKRDLAWAVDRNRQVKVLRFESASAKFTDGERRPADCEPGLRRTPLTRRSRPRPPLWPAAAPGPC